MRLTDKDKIKELSTLQNHNVLMTDKDYKELKLGQLEDIEDELGIDLTILFSALKKGIYAKDYGRFNVSSIDLIDGYIDFKRKNKKPYIHCAYLKDYGKTWALTKGELEKW